MFNHISLCSAKSSDCSLCALVRSRDTESHAFEVWKLLLFTWIHGPPEGFGVTDFEQDTLRNILTILSPINKTYVSVRLLVLKVLLATNEKCIIC